MVGFQMPPNILLNRILDTVIILMIITLVMVKNTYAYIDPGSGSYLLQIVAAGLLSSIFIIKKFWGDIKKIVSSLLKKISGKKNR